MRDDDELEIDELPVTESRMVLEQYLHVLPPRNEAVMVAIQQSIDAAGLAYAFNPGSYTMAALTAAMAVSQAYLRAPAAPLAPADGDNELGE